MGISAAIEDTINDRFIAGDAVIDGKGETSRQKSIIPDVGTMNASVEDQRIDFRKQTIDEIVADALPLVLVKFPTCGQIFEGGTKDTTFH